VMWLALFGSAGDKSFHLFEHTPQSCYPGTGWNILRQDVDAIPIGNGMIFAQRGLAEKDGQRLLVLYWYMWDNLERNPSGGVLSLWLLSRFTIRGRLAAIAQRLSAVRCAPIFFCSRKSKPGRRSKRCKWRRPQVLAGQSSSLRGRKQSRAEGCLIGPSSTT